MRPLFAFPLILALPLFAACIVDPGPSNRTPPPSGTAPASVPPMVVSVDTNQTMNAKGGEGVGVFVEYRAGGHWHVWLTCDTSVSGQDCSFKLSAGAASGSLRNLLPTSAGTAQVDVSNIGGAIAVSSRITTEVAGIDFDSDPGARVTIDASVSGLHTGDFFFFVQDGTVNGGFAGKFTNPLAFEPSQP